MKITSDFAILETVKGYRLEFLDETKPAQRRLPFAYKLDPQEKLAVDEEIDKLLSKKVIAHSTREGGQFISNVFTRHKKTGGYRMILDLSELNEYIVKRHFKMDTFESARTLITKNCYMASLDLRDAYYSVPIAKPDRKFLKFYWNKNLYEFTVLPNGLSSGPRLFTKLLKPPLSKLRAMGHVMTAYIDDSLLVGNTMEQTTQAVRDAATLLERLGFIIHPEKSIFSPTQEIEYLGFQINSKDMKVSLTAVRKLDIKTVCINLLEKDKHTIKTVAMVIGKLVAALPAVQYGPLYYRSLEQEKIKALKANWGHYDRFMSISNEAKIDLHWWIAHVDRAFSCIGRGKPDVYLTSDASGQGWGASDGSTHIGGRWNAIEMSRAVRNEINYLELLAAFLALKAFCCNMQNKHVKMSIDNTTAVAYIAHMGGSKSQDCNNLAKELWKWAIDRDMWISVVHLPGVQNIQADRKSRNFQDETEWMLDRDIFRTLSVKFKPEVDLFASRNNAQLQRYVSWLPDPGAEAVDALSLDWGNVYFYAFPPFCIIGKCLQKIHEDKAEGVIIVPKWPTQSWFPQMLNLLIQEPIVLPQIQTLLTQPVSGEIHPLISANKLILLACRLSGNQSRVKEYQATLPALSYHHGETLPNHSMMSTCDSGFSFVLNRKLIQCSQLQSRY